MIPQHQDRDEQCWCLTLSLITELTQNSKMFLSFWGDGEAFLLQPTRSESQTSPHLKEGLWRKELICFSGPPCLVSPAHGERESALCTHRVGPRDGLGLSTLAVMSLGVAWCKEVSAETVEG